MRKVAVPESGVSTFFGALDDNLRQLESLLNVRIRTQGHDLLVEGDADSTARVARLVEQLGGLMDEGHSISGRDVKTAAQLVAEDAGVDLREHFLKDGQLRTAGKRRITAKSGGIDSLLLWVIVAAGVLSSVLANDIVCLAMAPMLVEVCARRQINPPLVLLLA